MRLPVRLLSSFTATPLEPALRFWWSRLGLNPPPAIAPYGQLIQPLLTAAGSPADDCATVVLLRWEDGLRHRSGPVDVHRAGVVLEHRLAELAEALARITGTGRPPVVVIVCAASPAWSAAPRAGVLEYLDGELDRLARALGVQVLRAAPFAARYRPVAVADRRADDLGHMPYQPAYFTVLATIVVRAVLAAAVRGRTELVVDPLRTWYGGVRQTGGDLLWRRTLPGLTGATGRLSLLSVRAGVVARILVDDHAELGLLGDKLRCLSDEGADDDPVPTVARLADRGLLDPARTVLLDRDPEVTGRARSALPELAVVSTGGTPDEAAAAVAHSWALDTLALGMRLAPGGPALSADHLAAVAETPTDAAALHREVQRWRRART